MTFLPQFDNPNIRILVLALFVSIYGNCSSQNKIEIISLGQIESDSGDQQLTLYAKNSLSATTVIQITKRLNNWEYMRGIIKSKDSVLIFERKLQKLDTNQIAEYYQTLLNMRSQDSLILKNMEGLSIPTPKFFNQIMDGVEYVFSIRNKGVKRSIIYNNPEPYVEILESYGFGIEEHLQIINIVDYMRKLIPT